MDTDKERAREVESPIVETSRKSHAGREALCLTGEETHTRDRRRGIRK